MSSNGDSPRALLDAWREQRADRIDSARFHFIEALERRAARHHGEVRRLLDGRLSRLLEAYAGDLEKVAGDADGTTAPDTTAGAALGELADYANRQAATRGGDAATDDPALRSTFPELAALDDFRSLWSRLRTQSQLRQSLEQVPENAGPLNSGRLVHRSLMLMRELSPGYLQHFLAYVDLLSWMEQLDGGGAPAQDAPRAANPRKRPRSNRST